MIFQPIKYGVLFVLAIVKLFSTMHCFFHQPTRLGLCLVWLGLYQPSLVFYLFRPWWHFCLTSVAFCLTLARPLPAKLGFLFVDMRMYTTTFHLCLNIEAFLCAFYSAISREDSGGPHSMANPVRVHRLCIRYMHPLKRHSR